MKKSIFLFLIILSLLSCENSNNDHRKVDKFYTEKGGFDMARIPLIKPYQITSSSRNSWIVSAIDTSITNGTITGTKYVNVIDSNIFIYSRNTVLDGQPISQAWFIIVPKNHVFKGFKSHYEYLNYLSSIKMREPKFYDVLEIVDYFDKKDTLNWQELNRLY